METSPFQRQEFLSSNAQDFIEEKEQKTRMTTEAKFLSSNAQDFIEDVSYKEQQDAKGNS